MNESQLRDLLRDADRMVTRAAPAAAEVAARVRERSRRRADRRRDAVGVLAAAALVAVFSIPTHGRPAPVEVGSGDTVEAMRLLIARTSREAELATMVVRELRARQQADLLARAAMTVEPGEAARTEADLAANLLLEQARVFSERPELRSAAGWRCELILAAFPDSAAAREARRLLDSSGRSQRSASPLVHGAERTTQTDVYCGAAL